MAFSYSDKNFTVIGNLCFVHIILEGNERMIDIPPAIADRMLYPQIICTYPYLSSKEASGAGVSTKGIATKGIGYATKGIGYAILNRRKISLSNTEFGYLYCYFPIDSNK